MAEPATQSAVRTATGGARGPRVALPRRRTLAALLALGAVATLAATVGLHRRQRLTELALAVLVVVAAVVVVHAGLPRLRLRRVLDWGILLLPLAAIVGPALALPGRPQLFGFRLLLAAVVALAVLVWGSARRLPRLGPRTLVLLLAAWFAWLGVALLWAQSPADGLRYLGILIVEFVLLAATAAAGDARRRLRALTWTLAVGYGLAVLVGAGEALTGRHLQSSVAAHGGAKQHIATGFFFNPNDLATFIGIAWPFLLFAAIFAHRLWQRALALAFMGVGLFALLYTGSRSSLITIALTTLVTAGYVVVRHWVRHRGLVVAVTLIVLAAFGAVALNGAQSGLLQQFQVQSLAAGATSASAAGTGPEVVGTGNSAGTRLQLTKAGFRAVAGYGFLGVGPGNAENLVREQPDAPATVANLHDWWLEVFVVGGLPAFVLYVLFYLSLLALAFRAAARSRERFTRVLAAATGVALVGYVIGSLGPSTVVSFAPMWILFGLAVAVARRVRQEQVEAAATAPTTAMAAPASPLASAGSAS